MSPLTRLRCFAPQVATLGLLLGVAGLGWWFEPSSGPGRAPAAEGRLDGVALGLYPGAAAEAGLPFPPPMEEVVALGARAVLLPVPVMQDDLQSVEVGPGPDTPAPRDLRAVIRGAHAAGLRTALMPIIELRRGGPEDWRGRLAPHDPARWWQSYTQLVLDYAALAAAEHVEVLVVGSELTSRQGEVEAWRALTAAVRDVYSGRIALVANHDALDLVEAFETVDIAGVSAYFPLADDVDASQAVLHAGWAEIRAELQAFRRRVDRPLVVFEVGYPSLDGAAVRPWDYTSGAPLDLEEQRRAYAAASRGLVELAPEGVFFWMWFGPGGPHDRHYTPRGKPAEAALRRFFTWRARGS